MYTDSLLYPDWYKIEIETQKTISKLYELTDLDFYLKSADEYTRRLAIIRLGEIKPKESFNILKNIFDDPSESLSNKELAAWAIKAVSQKWRIDLFVGNRTLNKFTGSEKSEDIFKVSMIDSMSTVKYEFSSETLNRELKLENSSIKQYGDVNFDMPFSFKLWLISFLKYFLLNFRNLLTSLPIQAVSVLKTFFSKYSKWVFHHAINLIKSSLMSLQQRSKYKRNFRESYGKNYYKPSSNTGKAGTRLRNFLVNILYIAFFPVRTLIKHRLLFFCTVATCYCLLTLTIPGKILTYKYTGMDISEIQQKAFYSAKDFVAYAFSEARSLVGMEPEDPAVEAEETASDSPAAKLYTVIAKEGLNLREAPRATASKTINEALKYNSVVEFSGESKKDSSGRIWYFITTADGNAGWVNSKWLKSQ
jgi:hypothetical protein